MQLVAGGPPFVLDAGDELIDLGQRRRVAVPLGPVLGHQDPEQGALGLDGPNPTLTLVANSYPLLRRPVPERRIANSGSGRPVPQPTNHRAGSRRAPRPSAHA